MNALAIGLKLPQENKPKSPLTKGTGESFFIAIEKRLLINQVTEVLPWIWTRQQAIMVLALELPGEMW